MDPNETLRLIRERLARLADLIDDDDAGTLNDDAIELVEYVDALDNWMSGGGFLPDAWARKRKPGHLSSDPG